MLRIQNIKIRKNISDEALIHFVLKTYHISPSDVIDWHIVKKSIDARKKTDVHFQ